MILKGLIDYDCVNYKEPCLTLMFPKCDFKCDKINGCKVCQNWALSLEPSFDISEDLIIKYFLENPLTKAFCFQGLEPFDSFKELYNLIFKIRKQYSCEAPIIIYTGYNSFEIEEQIEKLKEFPNIIIKWGRYLMNQEKHFDKVLGVFLASKNQYGEQIS